MSEDLQTNIESYLPLLDKIFQGERIETDKLTPPEISSLVEIEEVFRSNPRCLEKEGTITELRQYLYEMADVSKFFNSQKEQLDRLTPIEEFHIMQSINRLKRRLAENWARSTFYYFDKNLGWGEERRKKVWSQERLFGFNLYDVYDLNSFLKQPEETKKKVLSLYPGLQTFCERCKPDEYQKLRETGSKVKQHLGERLEPEDRKMILKSTGSQEDSRLDDSLIDWLLGIKTDKAEENLDFGRLKERYGNEQFMYGGTPYDIIRHFLHVLKPSVNDVVYDLGSGYGRVCFYGSLTTNARYKGVEIAPERVEECNKVKKRLNIKNTEFIQGNVKGVDYSDGTIFYLFNPFTVETLEEVGNQLREIAQKKKIKIVSYGLCESYFKRQKWLRDMTPGASHKKYEQLRIFESR